MRFCKFYRKKVVAASELLVTDEGEPGEGRGCCRPTPFVLCASAGLVAGISASTACCTGASICGALKGGSRCCFFNSART
jgi:hypothetical protein